MSKYLQNEPEYETEHDPEYEPVSEPSFSRTRKNSQITSNHRESQIASAIARASSSRRHTEEATSSKKQDVHFELQPHREDSEDEDPEEHLEEEPEDEHPEEGILSRLRKRLVNSVHPANSTNNNDNHKTNGSINRSLATKKDLKETPNFSKATQTAYSANKPNQRVSPNARSPANRESSLIKQRLLKKQLWLSEQAMLSNLNANHLDDLNALAGYSDDEEQQESVRQLRYQRSLNGVDKSSPAIPKRMSNRKKTPSKPYRAGEIANAPKTRRSAKRKAKENLCSNKQVSFVADLNFSDLDELELNETSDDNLKESIHEFDSLKAPTKQIYPYVALFFVSMFAFKFINPS